MTEHFHFPEIAQFGFSAFGVVCGCRILYQYLIDLKYAAVNDSDEPRKFVAWSTVKRECLAVFSQVCLFSVGISYHWFPTPDFNGVIAFRQVMLLVITVALALKSYNLMRDRKHLIELLSK